MTGDKYPDSPGFARGSDTSEMAAASMVPSADSIRERVRNYIASRGLDGATCDEVQYALDMLHQTASARVTELRLRGDIIKSGEKRRTKAGRLAAVYLTVERD